MICFSFHFVKIYVLFFWVITVISDFQVMTTPERVPK